MSRRAQDRVLITLLFLVLAIIFLKLTYEVILTTIAMLQALVLGLVLFICGYYVAKHYLFKLFKY